MSLSSLTRLSLRQTRWVLQKRAQSTASEAASTVASAATKAKDSAQQAASQAQQGLSRVTSSAGNAVSGASSAASRQVSGVAGQTLALFRFAQSLVPPTIYYAQVVGELAQMVFRGRKMYPPSVETLQTYLPDLRKAMQNPSSIMQSVSSPAKASAKRAANAARVSPSTAAVNPTATFQTTIMNNIAPRQYSGLQSTSNSGSLTQFWRSNSAAITSVAVVTAEVLGFFTVGEMIGKFKIVGYRGATAHGEHH